MIENLRLPSHDGNGKRHRKGRLSESEIMTILTCCHFGTYRNFKEHYLCCIRGQLRQEFPDAVSYNRFAELMPRVFFKMMMFMKLYAFGKCSGISFVDSTMIPVCHNVRRYFNKVFKGLAKNGKGAMGWCHGFKLHLLCNDSGGGGHNLLSHRSKRRRQGWPGVESVHQGSLWKGVCRQKIYQAGTLRASLRPGNPSRTWPQGQHEEQAYAHVGQDHAQKKEHHRVYQRIAQEQGKPSALTPPVHT